MNRYVKATVYVSCGFLKMLITKLFNLRNFRGPLLCLASPLSEITMDSKTHLVIGRNFKIRSGAKVRVRKGARCIIGNNVFMNSNSTITCHEQIEIGDDVQLSPNVQIYDHDHDYSAAGGIKAEKFKTSPVIIGNNVWIGANTIILRGSEIGDNCVIGASCVIKGIYKDNTIVVQKRNETTKIIS